MSDNKSTISRTELDLCLKFMHSVKFSYGLGVWCRLHHLSFERMDYAFKKFFDVVHIDDDCIVDDPSSEGDVL